MGRPIEPDQSDAGRRKLVSDKISDLNFSVGQLPQVEINGKLTPVQPLGMQKLSPYQTEIIAMAGKNWHGRPVNNDSINSSRVGYCP